MLLLLLFAGMGITSGANAQSVSNCDQPLSQEFLDVNNVRARVFNSGALFYNGGVNTYEVPKGGGVNALFASGIWIGGIVNEQLRAAASDYGPYEFWPGPLDETGAPPADCSVYDEMYSVKKTDIEAYEQTGSATPDLAGWPTGLGAPTLDANGELMAFDINVPLSQRENRVIDLEAGERPAITGDQTIWWIMNDLGNEHEWSVAEPIGLEVHVEAFAFNLDGPVGAMTFYRYKLFYKGSATLTDAYMGLWSDPDLGEFQDDYVGSDSTLGLGFVYNSDNDDAGNYGANPPAVGYDFFQGPIVPSPGDTALVSGEQVPDFRNLSMTSFVFYNNGGGVQGDPPDGAGMYSYLRGRWLDEQPITFGGNGRGFSTTPTSFMYPGDPETGIGWSEINPAGDGTEPPIPADDRRFVMATGPFEIQPGDRQEIVFGIVYGQGSNNLNSVTELKKADGLAQQAFDVNFNLPVPPAQPQVSVTELDGRVVLEWSNSVNSNNYLEQYSEFDPLALDPFAELIDRTYLFEGYEVIRYADVADQEGEVVAVYDAVNGVQQVIDGTPGDVNEVVFTGRDNGIQTFHIVEQLTNYTNAYFGVRAIAYNELSLPKIFRSPVSRVTVVPARANEDIPQETSVASNDVVEADIIAEAQAIGDGLVAVDIVNPLAVTGDAYTVEFYERTISTGDAAGKKEAQLESEFDGEPDSPAYEIDVNKVDDVVVLTYDIRRGSETVFDGSSDALLQGFAPQQENVVLIDGLQFSVTGPSPDFTNFLTVANGAGPLAEEEGACADFQGFPCLRPSADQQVGEGLWMIHTGGQRASYGEFISRTTRDGARWDVTLPYDYEIRFTEEGGQCLWPAAFGAAANLLVDVPFELWRTGISTPDDPSDDIRMWCHLVDEDGNDLFNLQQVDHPASSASNDPYTDWFYWVLPTDETPGDAGYQATLADFQANIELDFTHNVGARVMDRMVLMSWNGGDILDADGNPADPFVVSQEMPEVGTVFRIITAKPNQPGDLFTVNTAGFEAGAKDATVLAEELDQISIVPNPYKGASNYERSQLVDEVRFTNLPPQATIRVFTLSGSLIRTLEKNSPERFLSWNLTTDNNLPVASGLYLVNIETDAGSTVVKFAVVRKRTELNNF